MSDYRFDDLEIFVYYGDSGRMKKVPEDSIDLVMTSPPYFNLKDYSEQPRSQDGQLPHSPPLGFQSYDDYLDTIMRTWKECARVVKRDGVVFVNVDIIRIKTPDKNIIPLPFHVIGQMEKLGFGCKDFYVYKKKTGVPFYFGKKLRNRSEYLLTFSRTNDYKFNLDSVREPYPPGYTYPPGHKRRSPKGMTPSTIWEYDPPFQDGRHHYHYNPFPDGLVDRAIMLFTDPGDWVLDPFLGSGAVVARAKYLGRNGLGYEINRHFKDAIEKRIESTPLCGGVARKGRRIDKWAENGSLP